jgi:thioesterase-3
MDTVTTDIKIRGYHIDLNGHVNNARYLEFLEEGRWVWSEQNMDFVILREKGLLFSVVNINIDYKRPAFISEVLEVQTSLESLGQTSGLLRQKIVLKGTDKLIVDGRVTFVLIDENTKKPINLEGELREKLEAVIKQSA